MARRQLTEQEKTERQEAKTQKSKDLAEKRVTAACEKIRLIGNLSGSNYNLTKGQQNQIFEALNNSVAYVLSRFEEPRPQEKEVFKFAEPEEDYKETVETD